MNSKHQFFIITNGTNLHRLKRLRYFPLVSSLESILYMIFAPQSLAKPLEIVFFNYLFPLTSWGVRSIEIVSIKSKQFQGRFKYEILNLCFPYNYLHLLQKYAISTVFWCFFTRKMRCSYDINCSLYPTIGICVEIVSNFHDMSSKSVWSTARHRSQNTLYCNG